jgi:hypothetical protein
MAAAASATRRACDGGAKLAEMARVGVTADEMTRTAVFITLFSTRTCLDSQLYQLREATHVAHST